MRQDCLSRVNILTTLNDSGRITTLGTKLCSLHRVSSIYYVINKTAVRGITKNQKVLCCTFIHALSTESEMRIPERETGPRNVFTQL